MRFNLPTECPVRKQGIALVLRTYRAINIPRRIILICFSLRWIGPNQTQRHSLVSKNLVDSLTLEKRSFVRWPILFLILLGLGVMLRREWRLQPDGHLHVHFLDVGQGDSALIVSPSGKQIVIDGGPDLTTLEEVGKKMPFFDRSIDLLVLTHPNTDHLVALPSFLHRYRISQVLVTGVPFELGRYEELLVAIEDEHPAVIFADPAKDLDFGDGLVFDIVWPPTDAAMREWEDLNDASIVFRALYNDQSI